LALKLFTPIQRNVYVSTNQEISMHNRTPFKKLAFWAVPLALMLCSTPEVALAYETDGVNGQLISESPTTQSPRDAHLQLEQELGLNPEQAKKVNATMQQGRGQSAALRQQLKAKREAMMRYVQSPGATEAGARNLNAEMNELQRQLGEIRLKTWFSMRSQLTPAQLEKLNALKAQRKSKYPQGGHYPKGDSAF
jgi:Spy/CpxP family protein refolding chaperone